MKTKKIFFLDIDGTLIDLKYQSNAPKAGEFFLQAEAENCFFSLNSNRAIEDLLPLYRQFNFNGVIIGENGLFAYTPSSQEMTWFIDEEEKKALLTAREHVKARMKAFLSEKYHFQPATHWLDVDTVQWLTETEISQNIFQEGNIVVLNNVHRLFTLSAHVKICAEGKFQTASKIIPDLVRSLQQEFAADPLFEINFSEEFGNILFYSKKLNKKTAIQKIAQENRDALLVGIGDEMNDWKMMDGVGQFYTTQNTKPEVQQKAVYTSPYSYTQGVIDIVGKLL
jgi:HAD superfamily hydrolase (TIGR01484 family)